MKVIPNLSYFFGISFVLTLMVNSAFSARVGRRLRAGRNVTATVSIELYYECMCPYSRRFITQQLWPTYTKLRKFMKVALVPYGNAHTKERTTENGTRLAEITCQHGPNECRGNVVQCCAVVKTRSTFRVLSFVACMSVFPDAYKRGKECARDAGVSWKTISACATGYEGPRLLYEMGKRTRAQSVYVSHVPYVVVNGRYDRSLERRAVRNLFALVCSLLGSSQPRICSAE